MIITGISFEKKLMPATKKSLFYLFTTVRLPRFVMRQDVFLRLAVHNVDVVIGQVDWLYPVTGCINHDRDASTSHAARDQHRHQACG